MNGHDSINIAVLTTHQDDVELVNQILRNAGFAAHCHWVTGPAKFDQTLSGKRPELVVLNRSSYPDSVRQVVKQKDVYQPELSVIAVSEDVDESQMLAAMKEGAVDLVSLTNVERLQAVVSRELRACRIERALNSTIKSATSYRKQLFAHMEGSARAIAYVQEGILTNANQAWLELFGAETKEAVTGLPLMDCFEPESQAAVKGAIVATTKSKWQPGEKLSATARLQNGRAKPLELDLQLAEFDDGPQVQISIAPNRKSAAEPTKLVHDALKRDPTTLFFHRAQFLERITKRLAKKPASGTSCARVHQT